MIRIRPFRALHYDAAAVGDLAAVIAPPYDVIDDRQLDAAVRAQPLQRGALDPQPVARSLRGLRRRADRVARARRAGPGCAALPVLLRAGLRAARRRAPAARRPDGGGAPGALRRRQHPPARAHLRPRQGGPPEAPRRLPRQPEPDLRHLSRSPAGAGAGAPAERRGGAVDRRRRRGGRPPSRLAHRRSLAHRRYRPGPLRQDGVHRRRPPPLRDRARLSRTAGTSRATPIPRRRTTTSSCT